MYQIIIKAIVVLMLLFAGVATAGQGIWQDASSLQAQAKSQNGKIHYYSADHAALHIALSQAPHELTGDWSHQIQLPMPDGEIIVFNVVESPVMAAALAAKYPQIKSYKVRGVDDPNVSGRIGITPLGLYGMIHTSAGAVYLDPEDSSSQTHVYRSRFKGIVPQEKFSCGVHDAHHPAGKSFSLSSRVANRMPGNLLEYDLAVAATFEYYQFFGSSLVNTMSAISMTIMQVNSIYERDLGITLKLVDDNDDIIETSVNGPLNNNDIETLLYQTEDWIDSNLPGGDAAYDIGHMFSVTPFVGGGLAFLGVVCDDDFKANGVSGFPNPAIGAPFDIDFVAHEIGHQFNANHSFNGTNSACGTGRNSSTAFEPGSGSTIMAYAGICGTENLQSTSDATFHAGSISEIDSFTRGAGNCAVRIATTPLNNNDPIIPPIPNRTIPANTPFILDVDGSPTDPDMDGLDYQWDQMDAGCPTNSTSFGTDNGSNALFRSYVPRSDSWRNFPALGTQVQAGYDKAEVLPCQNRDLDFRLTARDGNSGQNTEDVRVSVDNSAGPFKITSVNIIPPITQITVGEEFEVNWEVANTNLQPISCASVDFELINFSSGYLRYYVETLNAVSNDNDGTDLVTLVNPVSDSYPLSRVRVKCSDNIFYDLSDTDLTVATKTTSSPAIDFETYFPENMFITGSVAPVCGPVVDCTPTVTTADSSGKGGGSGAIDYLWLLMMTGLVGLVNLYRRYGLQ